MLIKAEQKFVRISPRKVRLVANAIRGLSVAETKDQLKVLNKRAALPLRKTLHQAIANAVNNKQQLEENLTIKEIQIGEGPTFKRWQPVSRGRAHPILKRVSHIKIILESKAPAVAQSQKALPKPKPQSPTRKKTKTGRGKSISKGKSISNSSSSPLHEPKNTTRRKRNTKGKT